MDFSKLSTLSIGIGGRIGRRNSIGNGEYNGQSGVFGVEGLLNNGTPMSGYGLDSEGHRIVSDPDLVGAVGSDGLGLIYQHGYTVQRQNVVNLDLQYKLKLDFITKGLDFRIKGSYNSDYTQQKARTTSGGISYKATIAKGEYEEDGAPKVVYVRQGDSWPLGYEGEEIGGAGTGMQRRVSTIPASSVTTISVRSFFIMNLKTTILAVSIILSPVVM